jgi:signal transduction histidine kinase/ActR/RegA family two-component response regulator/HAMP domain-containing protein
MSTATTPIRRKLTAMVLLTCGAVLLLSTLISFAYEFITYRRSALESLATLGRVVATNSTAALAFQNPDDARSVLNALSAEPHIVSAALYTQSGDLFATYPGNLPESDFPARAPQTGFRFESAHLLGVQPVVENGRAMGSLYVKSDLRAMTERLWIHAGVTVLIVLAAGALAFALSRRLQRQISGPILALADTARAVSQRKDWSVRAPDSDTTELSTLTNAFNLMLTEIQGHDAKLQTQLARLALLQHITRAIAERQDLPSIFHVVLQSLEDNLPIDFCCVCQYDAAHEMLTTIAVGSRSAAHGAKLAIEAQSQIPIDQNGLARCVAGNLVYEPDVRRVQFPFPQRLASNGLRSLVIAPLSVENRVFGVMIAARAQEDGFMSADCEFLKHLSEHVALASHQTQLHGALQQAYDDLRQTQHTVMQQERLRALGQMASGIAHDINNAISPVSLYTESMLEREPNLSERARSNLTTIQRAMEDVAGTVARLREFYRPREVQLQLARVDVNRLVAQVLELTHARWSDMAQQRGAMIDVRQELEPSMLEIMGAEGEIRDALTNLIFNAVDAMPNGGTLTVRSRIVVKNEHESLVHVEVTDTGVGMDDETRRRCLEPFFTTKGERGTGLGLAMVYGMIQRHSAEMEIDSTPGSGTTIRLIFPAYSPAFETTVRVSNPQVVRHRLRILVVDDDPLLIKSLNDILEADGHVVSVANGGQAGIDAFTAAARTSERFSIVITDLGMPYLDGRKVAAAVKGISARTPVIMLTGWGQRLLAEDDIPPHVDKVLSKPPRLHELRGALAELTAETAEDAPRVKVAP